MTTETKPTPAAEPTVPSTQPGFGRRLARAFGRFLKALLKVTLVIIIIVAAGYITFLIVQELQRSFGVVSGRVDYNQERINVIREELNALDDEAGALNETQDGRLQALESYVDTTLAEDLTQQAEMLAVLELQLNTLLSQTQTLDTQVGTLNDGVVALQSDINENNGRIDELGGSVDALGINDEALTTQVAELQTTLDELPLEDIEQMRQVVTLFRVWEMVARARLHILENNAGLAAIDTTNARAAVDTLLTNENTNPDLLPTLTLIQARLTLADANLPQSPALAAFDLENAWFELDTALALLLGIEDIETAVLPAEPPAGDAAEATPEATATPDAED